MKRRTFVQAVGAGALWTLAPGTTIAAAREATPPIRLALTAGHSLGWFPNVTAPRILATSDGTAAILIQAKNDTILQIRRRKQSLGLLARARMTTAPDGTLHVAGLRDGGLWLIRVAPSGKVSSVRLASLPEPHAAAGLDLVWTPDGMRIVAPGPRPQTVAFYSDAPGGAPRVLTIHAWAHPILRYDTARRRLHLLLCPWIDASAIYSTVYYLRSDDHGESWRQADGTTYDLPLQPNSREHGLERPRPEVVTITGQPNGGHSNTLAHGLELDPDGHPHFLYSFNRPYHLAREPFMRCAHVCWDGTKWSLDRWDGSKWKFGELSADFAVDIAGGCLDIVDRDTLHALVMFKDRKASWLDLGTTSSRDGGRTWSAVRALTADANARAAHYVAPQWARVGDAREFICSGFNRDPRAPLYRGRIDERRFA